MDGWPISFSESQVSAEVEAFTGMIYIWIEFQLNHLFYFYFIFLFSFAFCFTLHNIVDGQLLGWLIIIIIIIFFIYILFFQYGLLCPSCI